MAINVVVIHAAIQFHSFLKFFFDIGFTGSCCKCRQPVFMSHDSIECHSSRKLLGPPHKCGYSIGPFPVTVFFTSKRCCRRIGPRIEVRAVVRRIKNDSVFSKTELIKVIEEFANMHVVLNHAIVIVITRWSSQTFMLFLYMCSKMHPSSIPPTKKRLASRRLPLHKILCC